MLKHCASVCRAGVSSLRGPRLWPFVKFNINYPQSKIKIYYLSIEMNSKAVFVSAAVLVLAVFAPTGSALRCWTCSSDLDPRCGDTFNTTLSYGSYGSHGYTLTDCNAQSSGGSYPYITTARSVCKKSKQLVNGDLTIIRSCAWQMPDQPVGQCSTSASSQQVRVLFCETCETDACNGSNSLVLTPILAVISAIVLLLKLR